MEDIMACNVSSASLKRSSAEGGIWKQSEQVVTSKVGKEQASSAWWMKSWVRYQQEFFSFHHLSCGSLTCYPGGWKPIDKRQFKAKPDIYTTSRYSRFSINWSILWTSHMKEVRMLPRTVHREVLWWGSSRCRRRLWPAGWSRTWRTTCWCKRCFKEVGTLWPATIMIRKIGNYYQV